MIVAQGILFCWQVFDEGPCSMEEFVGNGHYDAVFKFAYILITIVIVLPGMNFGSVQSYTLKRLQNYPIENIGYQLQNSFSKEET